MKNIRYELDLRPSRTHYHLVIPMPMHAQVQHVGSKRAKPSEPTIYILGGRFCDVRGYSWGNFCDMIARSMGTGEPLVSNDVFRIIREFTYKSDDLNSDAFHQVWILINRDLSKIGYVITMTCPIRHEEPSLWAMCHEHHEIVDRRFLVVPTGCPIPLTWDDAKRLYIGTIISTDPRGNSVVNAIYYA